MVFSIRKCHPFLYGRHFTIYTDHKPLWGIFRSDKPTPIMASGRIQRWSLTLTSLEFVLVYRPVHEMEMLMLLVV